MSDGSVVKKIQIGGGRNLSLDLLRIIAMMLVLVLHTNLFGGFLKIQYNDAYCFLINLYEQFAIVAVNVFVIISAWFLRTKCISFSKVITLIWIILFWTVVMSLVSIGLGECISFKDLLMAVPVIGRAYDFCSGYIVMYLFSPYLNKMLDNISFKWISLLAVGAFLLFSCLSPITSSHYLLINGGYSFTWFIMLYIITAWIKSLEKFPSKELLICVYFMCSLVGAVAVFFNISVIRNVDYNNPVVTISAFSLFLAFAQIKIQNPVLIRFISFFAPLSFGVFLIHAHPVLERWYQQFQFCNWLEGNVYLYLVGMPIFVIILFILCSLMEKLRMMLFKAIHEKELTGKFCNSLDVFCSKMIGKLDNKKI